ncbi:putative transcription factor ovo-like protein 3 [Python bivittatus]|uniref:Transcription factor ovo-like protein 3 n=1 Tax=Python bivittatus TaxID=176946 RepID=A0A9F3W0J3_PYTBI|nr:putative transcription factor ovo-like protein 3 [Python bivittatus]
MPKSFLVKCRNSAQLGTRNWSELSDQLRGDSYGRDPGWLHNVLPTFLPSFPFQGRSLPTQADFQCCVCSKRFPLQRMLNRHRKCHSSIKKRTCQYCSKGFNDTFDLKRHLRTHTGIRPYRCCLCDKGFTQRCSLESHLKKIHSIPQSYGYRERRTKLFVCEECGFTCSTSDEYYGHTRQGHSTSGFLGGEFPKPGPAGFQTPLPILYHSVY